MQPKRPILLLFSFLLIGQYVMSQVAGDYRTNNANVTWLTPGNWQRYDGTGWVTATEYPGQNPGTGTVTIRNNQNVSLGSSIPFAIGALTFESGNNAMNLTFGGAFTLNVTGAVTLNGPSNNGTRYIAVDAGTLNCASLSLGTTDNDNKIAQLRISTGTVTVGGNLTLNSPGVRNNITINSTGTLNIAGSFTGGGAAGISFATGSTVNFNGTGAQTIPAYNYQNLTCSGNNVKSAAASFSVAGTLNIAAGIELSMDNFDLTGASLLTSGSGALTTSSSSASPLPAGRTWSFTVQFTRPGNQTIPGGTYNSFLYCSGGGTKSAGGNLALNSGLVIGSGITLDMGSSNVMSGGPTFVSSLGTIKTAVPTATSAAPLPSGVNWGTSGVVEYAAATAQTAMAGSYYNLTSSGGGTKTATGAITVAGTLNLTSGKINTGTSTLTLTNADPALHIVGGNSSTYVYSTGAGRLRRNNLAANSGAKTFPVGTANYLMYVQVDPLDATSDFAVSVFQGLTQDGTPTGTPFTNLNPVVNATWNIDRPVGTGDAEVLVSWDAALEGSAFATFTGPQIGISHFTLGNWQLAIGSGDNVANTAIATFSSFSPFAVGKTGTVLPVTFSNLKAYEKQRGVQVDWNVTSDKNVSSYAVERSADGRNFSKIGTVTANQSDLASAYGFYDASPLPGTGYYRIASQQKDGSNSLSAVLRVNLNKSIKETIIYPNPVKGSMLSLLSTNLEKGNYSIRMYSVNGQELLQLRFDHNGGAINQMINLPQSLQPGLYDIMLDKAGSRVMSKKVMVQ
jgi:hypothetical protein